MSISIKRLEEIQTFKDTDISDIPEMTDEQLKELKPSHLRNPENYRPVKKKICMYLDADILEWYKADGKRGYQTKINQVLRQNMLRESSPVYGKVKDIPEDKKD
ncbi:BrnA antitoxin family protein [uncultured Sphaerochaeta sp.]|uniref:BrnA antitoxin family protein n=1 Tax=uncultured Sphaerochaeta sp. TaxID=886478 RepID=UPI002A0A92EA|nr:BrnA antitoxin family protein [uncultured Sphaerochaeta sp.]